MRQRKGISYIWPTKYEEWADGFLAGNGTLGIIVFGDPLKETVIFNHQKFNIAATRPRSFSQVIWKRSEKPVPGGILGGQTIWRIRPTAGRMAEKETDTLAIG